MTNQEKSEMLSLAVVKSHKKNRKHIAVLDSTPIKKDLQQYRKDVYAFIYPENNNWVLELGSKSYTKWTYGETEDKVPKFPKTSELCKWPGFVKKKRQQAIFKNKVYAWVLALVLSSDHPVYTYPYTCGGKNYTTAPDIYYYNMDTVVLELSQLLQEQSKKFPLTIMTILTTHVRDGKFKSQFMLFDFLYELNKYKKLPSVYDSISIFWDFFRLCQTYKEQPDDLSRWVILGKELIYYAKEAENLKICPYVW